ncbi:uncharacterized protein LOC131987869 [Centropristis striata]|uniref:uncharacterized protein LOC131987869 n=1 Tax=Centropristis striata TaxID=184440 RepID=UPI0027DF111E|nr:uncharacterized protein LOC131987869 [Centropristis striata]
MAEVRLHLRRGTYNFAHKICSRYLLESQNSRRKAATHASSLSAGLPLVNVQTGAEKPLTAGLLQDGYTKITPRFGTVDSVWDNGHITDCGYFKRHKEFLSPNKCQVGRIDKGSSRYRINGKFRRTLCPFRAAQRVGVCQFVFIRAYSDTGSRAEPLYRTKTGYYDILEVLSTATQSQIKTAYYKQSFVYHPDRNPDSEVATVRFSEISEAYAVLGNKALRKKYDRGLLSQSDLITTARPSAKHTDSPEKQQTESRRSEVAALNRKEIFDFDNFIKSHYGEQLQREKDLKTRREEMLRKKNETVAEKEMIGLVETGAVFMLAMGVYLLSSLK